jgi:hypothetical protein
VAQSSFGDRRVLLQQDQNSGGVCATFRGPKEDRTINEAQLRRRHLPAGQPLRHRDPRHRDVPPFSAALNALSESQSGI